MNSKTVHAAQQDCGNPRGGRAGGCQQQTMPIIGGEVVILEFISDYDIVGGLRFAVLACGTRRCAAGGIRACVFLQEQTVYKGTARYDGKPVFGEAFVMIEHQQS